MLCQDRRRCLRHGHGHGRGRHRVSVRVTDRRIALCYGCRFGPDIDVHQKDKKDGKHGSNDDRTLGLKPVLLVVTLFLQWKCFVRSGFFDIQRFMFGFVLRLGVAFLLREDRIFQTSGFCCKLGLEKLFKRV